MTLISKIQYRNFEPGEFTDNAARSFPDTISLIEAFPWEDQRDHLQISLTNPSITITNEQGNYLKLALFYNGKFVLHYFDEHQQLYTIPFTTYQDTYPYIQTFFETPLFDPKDFRKENTWGQHNLVHFADKDFRYQATPKRARQFLISTSWMWFAISLFLISNILYQGHYEIWVVDLLMLGILFLFGGGINLLVFFNYYRSAANKILIMSKGNPVFYYGDEQEPKMYNKADIMQVKIYQNPNSRSPLNSFARIEIEMKSGQYLDFPNLLINEEEIVNKLEGYSIIKVTKGIPLMPSYASTPS